MPRVAISTQAFAFLSKRTSKKSRQMESLPENELRKNEREVKHWVDLAKKFAQPPVAEMTLKRVELKTIQVMVLDTMVHIQSKAMPEYQERMSKVPDKKAFYQEYVAKLENLYTGLSELLDTIKKAIV